MFDIQKIIQELAKKRPVFHSEADFQHALAWEIHIHYPNANIRIERPYMIEGKKFYIDLIVEMDKKIIAIELKYKTKIPKNKIEINGEHFDLTKQGAQNWGRYHFINDIVRIEKLIENYPVSQGYAIFLTNDLYYQHKPRDSADFFDFSLENKEISAGILKWKDEKKVDKALCLKNSYTLHWQPYNDEGDDFHYLVVKI